jgi:hypothetical protein
MWTFLLTWPSFLVMLLLLWGGLWVAVRASGYGKLSLGAIYLLGLQCLVMFGAWGWFHEINLEQNRLQTESGGMNFFLATIAYIIFSIFYLVLGAAIALVSAAHSARQNQK